MSKLFFSAVTQAHIIARFTYFMQKRPHSVPIPGHVGPMPAVMPCTVDFLVFICYSFVVISVLRDDWSQSRNALSELLM